MLEAMYVSMYVCKDTAAPAHARTRAHRPAAAALRQSFGVSQRHIPGLVRRQAFDTGRGCVVGAACRVCGVRVPVLSFEWSFWCVMGAACRVCGVRVPALRFELSFWCVGGAACDV